MDPVPAGAPPGDAVALACDRCGADRIVDARFCVSCGAAFADAADRAARPAASALRAVISASRTRPRPCRGCDLDVVATWTACPRCGIGAPAARRRRSGAGDTIAAPDRAPGWYPDPFGSAGTRWWDGQAWTPYAARGAVHWDPATCVHERQPGIRGIGIAILAFGIGIALGFPASFALHEAGEPGGRAVLILVSAFTLWACLGGAVAYVTFVRGSRSLVADFGLRLRWADVPLGVAGWIAGRILGTLMIIPIVAIWPDIEPVDDEFYGNDSISAATWVVIALVVVVGAPFVEELFFRGLVQTRLVDRFGAVTGIAITSVMFGAAHLVGWFGPETFVLATAITGAGIVLGILRYLTGRLGPSIMAHAFFNAQALIVVALLR